MRKRIIIVVLLCGIMCLYGCTPSFLSPPEDKICVEWQYNLAPLQPSAFIYNEIEYRLIDSQWKVDESSTKRIGTLLTGGTGGSSAPVVILGVPILCAYRDAYSYNSNEEKMKFIATPEAVWLDSSISLDDKDNLPLYKLDIVVDTKCDTISNEISGDNYFTFNDMIDKNNTIEQQESTLPYQIRLYLQEVRGLFCYIEIVQVDDSLYTPLHMCEPIIGQGQQLVLLTDKWKENILSLICSYSTEDFESIIIG